MKIRENLKFNKIGNEGIIFEENSGNFFLLNEVAVKIIEEILNQENPDIESIFLKIREEYDVDDEELKFDIECFIREICEYKFIV